MAYASTTETFGSRLFRSAGLLVLALGCASPAPASQVPNEPPKPSLSVTETSDASVVFVRVPGAEGTGTPVVKFLEKTIPLYSVEGGWEGVVPIPYLQPSGEARIEVSAPGGAPVSLPVLIKQNTYKSEKLTVDPGKVKPKKKDLERIKKEGGMIKRVYRTLTPKKYWTGNFVLPVQSEFTSPYGTKRTYNGMMTGSHQGVDLRAPTGTPIYSPAPGRVAFVYNMFLTGHTIVLDHGYGLFTVYAHLSRTDVKEGQEIPTQHLLGLAGATGRVSGPHLHWGATIHDVKVNPQSLLQGMR